MDSLHAHIRRVSRLQELAEREYHKVERPTPQSKALRRSLRQIKAKATKKDTNQCENPPETLYGPVGRCRKCTPCLRHRQWEWSRRAHIEYQKHPKTWFVTLTWRTGAPMKYSQVTKYLQSLRESGLLYSYMTAQEHGTKNGRYHVHCLIHGPLELTKSRLRYIRKDREKNHANARWKNGNIDIKLVRKDLSGDTTYAYAIEQENLTLWRNGNCHGERPKTPLSDKAKTSAPIAKYLGKYFGKDRTSKMAASTRYGSTPEQEWLKQYFSDKFKCEQGWRDPKGNIIEEYTFAPFLNKNAINAYPESWSRERRIKHITAKVEHLALCIYPRMTESLNGYQLVYPRIMDQLRQLLPHFKRAKLHHNQDQKLLVQLPEHRTKSLYKSGYFTNTTIYPCWSFYGYQSTRPMPLKFDPFKFIGPHQQSITIHKITLSHRRFSKIFPDTPEQREANKLLSEQISNVTEIPQQSKSQPIKTFQSKH